jgi:predicted ATPase/DNA-binding SARP family transcriptional activator/Tfp pilus assembly protein PilF
MPTSNKIQRPELYAGDQPVGGATLRIETLGGLQLTHADAPIEGLASRKAEALLVYLACQGRPQSRDLLADLLWDDLPPERSRSNLSVLLTSLRQQLGLYIATDRLTVAFNRAAPYTLDLEALEMRLSAALPTPQAALDPAGADQVATALELYRGEFLQGFVLRGATGFEQWALATHERVSRMVIAARSALVAAYLAQGAYQAGLDQAHQLLQADPFNEEAHGNLLRLLAASGQQATALAHYAGYSRQLEQELNAAPGPQLVEIYRQLRSGALAPVKATPPPNPPVASRHELVATVRPGLRNAPFQPNAFVGRQSELARITASLRDSSCRLLTLVGPGGVGKTRLALEVAATLSADFADGAVFVPLAGVDHEHLLADAIAAAIGVRFSGSADQLSQLLTALRDREILLVLDNFEHLLAGSEQLNALLFAAPRLRLLVTSREPLHLSAEWIFQVPGMEHPPVELESDTSGWKPLDDYSAVRLFVERARRARNDFTLDSQTAPHIARICRLVEGLPLAIELAASWVRTIPCAQIADDLRHNLGLLSSPLRDVPERHRSVRAVFDQSWRMLAPAEQRTLAQLSVFRGGFTLAAAREVVGAGDTPPPADDSVLRTLSLLIDKSMLRQNQAGRYELHELLRQFVAEQLDAADAVALEDRYSAYYLGLVHAQQDALYGPEPQLALAAIRTDLDHVRHAWGTAVRSNDGNSLRLAVAGLRRYCDYMGLLHEGADLFGSAAEATRTVVAEAGGPDAQHLLVELLLAWGRMLSKLARYDESNAVVAEAAALAQATGMHSSAAFAHCQWGTSLHSQGATEAAVAKFEQALELARAAGEPRAEAEALQGQAVIAFIQGAIPHARDLFEQSLALYRAAGDRMWVSLVLNNLGVTAYTAGDYAATERYLAEALALREGVGDMQGQPYTLNNIGYLARVRGDYRLAQSRIERSLALFKAIGDRIGQAIALGNLGDLALIQGDDHVARARLEEALDIARSVGDFEREAGVLSSLALLNHNQGASEEALKAVEAALARALEVGIAPEEARARLILGHVLADLGRLDAAEAAYAASLRLRRANGEAKSAIEPQAGLVRVALDGGNAAAALALAEEILPLLEQELAIEDPFRVYLSCYHALAANRDPRAGATLLRAQAMIADRAAHIDNAQTRERFLNRMPIELDVSN